MQKCLRVVILASLWLQNIAAGITPAQVDLVETGMRAAVMNMAESQLGLSVENQSNFTDYVENEWAVNPTGSYGTFVANTVRQIQTDAADFDVGPDVLITWMNDPANFAGTEIAPGTADAYQSVINTLNAGKAAAESSGSQFEPIVLEAADFQVAARALVSSGKAGGASEGVIPTTGTGTGGGLTWLSKYSALASVTNPEDALADIYLELQKGEITMNQFKQQLNAFKNDAADLDSYERAQAEQIFDQANQAGRMEFQDYAPVEWE